MVWSSFKWSFESQMEIENLLIQIAEQSSSDHPGCKQGPGEGAADIGPHASSGQRGENTPVAISRPKGKKREKSPTAVPFPATSWSCRSSSRWRTSFSAAATTLLRFCRKFCSSAHRSNPRRASRFLGLKHRPWVLRPGHQHYILLLAVVNSSCACVYVYKLVNGQHNVINEKEQHHRQASANCCSCYQECKWECRAEHDVLLWYSNEVPTARFWFCLLI